MKFKGNKIIQDTKTCLILEIQLLLQVKILHLIIIFIQQNQTVCTVLSKNNF